MAEFVNREELIERMEGFCLANCGCRHSEDVLCSSCRMNDAIIMTEDQTAADVLPVVHGEWIYIKPPDDWVMSLYRCNVCGHLEEGQPNFCANCGSNMMGAE